MGTTAAFIVAQDLTATLALIDMPYNAKGILDY
jgi:hypothetical protein